MTQQHYQKIRHRIGSILRSNSVLIVFSAKEHIRNNDVYYKYRQSSNFYYLTGINDSNLVLIIEKVANKQRTILLCPRPTKNDTIWTGSLLSKGSYKRNNNFDDVYYYDELHKLHLAQLQNLYYEFDDDNRVTELLDEIMSIENNRYNKTGKVFSDRVDISAHLHEMRCVKNSFEIKQIKTAAKVSAKAHIDLMKNCKSSQYEYEIHANFINLCMKNECEQAYPAIVASGKNSLTLHYTKNTSRLKGGDLLLVDAAAEYNNYASDITRTIPISGKFTNAQKSVYEVVLNAQQHAINSCKTGKSIQDVHKVAVKYISMGLIKLGLLKGSLESVIKQESYKRFYMHNTGHWLGLDVHDPSPYLFNNKPVKFKPGMIFTVEPGLYIDNSKDVDVKYRNIGIRIEDDILITKNGPEILTESVPKSPSDIERLMTDG